MAENKYITVAYELYTTEEGERELIEKAPANHPFQFISGMGLTLDAFEAQITGLKKGDKFDFTLSVEEAYGPYVPEAVQSVPKNIFEIDGKLNTDYIYEGAVVPLQNSEGERFNGTITEIGEELITVDLNHPLAGKELNFVGEVTENREATTQEVADMVKMLTGGGCGSCGGGCKGGDCGGGCGGDCSCGGCN